MSVEEKQERLAHNRTSLFISAAGGFLTWALSYRLTGRFEPWDSEVGYFAIAATLTGMVARLFPRRSFGFTVTGFWIGQILGIALMSNAETRRMMAPGIVMSLFASFAVFPGWILGEILEAVIRRLQPK